MADQANNEAPQMPEPQPVFDVTYQHLYTPGGVFPQMYVFLWVAVAFVVGTILPWNADGSRVILQPLLLVISIGCVWSSIASIRSRRLSFWPILTLEIVAFVFLFLFFGEVAKQDAFEVIKQGEIVAANQIPEEIDRYNNETLKLAKWGFMDISFGAIMPAAFGDVNSFERRMVDNAWGKFGLGFHMTWITTMFVGLFVAFTIVMGIIKAKPKEDPAEARRAARRAGKDDGDGDGEAEAKKFATNTTLKNVAEDSKAGDDAKKDGKA